MSQPVVPSEIEDEYAWSFFGANAEYYLDLWRLRQQGKTATFSIAAFFLGLFWVLYRRMYLVAVLLVVAQMLEAAVEEGVLGLQHSTGTNLLGTLVQATLLGFFGNKLYLWHAERKMRKLIALNLPRQELLERLRRAGGTSWWPLLIVLGVVALWVLAYVWLSQQPKI